MDTGYVNYLSENERLDVLRWTRRRWGVACRLWRARISKGRKAKPFLCIETNGRDCLARRNSDFVSDEPAAREKFGEKGAIYVAASKGYSRVLAFELGKMFAPNGEIFDEETVAAG